MKDGFIALRLTSPPEPKPPREFSREAKVGPFQLRKALFPSLRSDERALVPVCGAGLESGGGPIWWQLSPLSAR